MMFRRQRCSLWPPVLLSLWCACASAKSNSSLRRHPSFRQLQGAGCPEECSRSWLDDGECDLECDNFACDLDKGDCKHKPTITREKFGECPPTCPLSYLGNEWCDPECDIAACHNDLGDCTAGCAPGCLDNWTHDGYCDQECDNKQCDYDKGDCKHPSLDLRSLEKCPYTCPLSWVGDGFCDEECDSLVCKWDGEDCSEKPPEKRKCASDCDPLWLGDGTCDFECNNQACEYDKGDCPTLTPACAKSTEDCPPLWLADGECDSECNTPECEYDKGDCVGDSKKLSQCEKDAPTCFAPWLADGECDPECNNVACEYDKGDCPSEVPPKCKKSHPTCEREWLADGECDDECNADECSWDWGDCEQISPECQQTAADCEGSWLGDGECDPECYTKGCNYDEGDCQRPAPCTTTGSKGVGEDVECIFPFRYRGVLYDKCTVINSDYPWCTTQISARGEHVKDQWGQCQKSCEVTCVTSGTAGVGAGHKCDFPFVYEGVEYDSCTSIESTAPWCATMTGNDNGYMKGYWGECAPACKGFKAAHIAGHERKKSINMFMAILVMAVVLLCLVGIVVYQSRKIKQLGVGNAARSEYAQKIGSSEIDCAPDAPTAT